MNLDRLLTNMEEDGERLFNEVCELQRLNKEGHEERQALRQQQELWEKIDHELFEISNHPSGLVVALKRTGVDVWKQEKDGGTIPFNTPYPYFKGTMVEVLTYCLEWQTNVWDASDDDHKAKSWWYSPPGPPWNKGTRGDVLCRDCHVREHDKNNV